jgi:hypothetical protein
MSGFTCLNELRIGPSELAVDRLACQEGDEDQGNRIHDLHYFYLLFYKLIIN